MIGREIADYRITRQIADGGAGTIYEGTHVRIGSLAAIKILRRSATNNATLAERVMNEARVVHQVGEGVVKTFDAGVLPDGTAFIVMEYLHGEDLAARLKRDGKKLPLPETLNIAHQIARTMAVAHEKGAVHRDLKPANVFLVRSAARAKKDLITVKILDFGLVKVRLASTSESGGRRLTQPGERFGTSLYIAPEQIHDMAAVDGQADVYSLGVMMFEMLAGRLPFEETDAFALKLNHLKVLAPRLADVASDVPPALAELVDSMLAKSPPMRPAMLAVETSLEELLLVTAKQAAAVPSVPGVDGSVFPIALGQRPTLALSHVTPPLQDKNSNLKLALALGALFATVISVGTTSRSLQRGASASTSSTTPNLASVVGPALDASVVTPPDQALTPGPRSEDPAPLRDCWLLSKPPGASVLDATTSKFLGNTPLNLPNLAAKQIGLKLSLRGYQPATVSFGQASCDKTSVLQPLKKPQIKDGDNAPKPWD